MPNRLLDHLEWFEDDGDQEVLLMFLQHAIIENELDIPRKATKKLLENKAKVSELDEDIVTILENLAEQLEKL